MTVKLLKNPYGLLLGFFGPFDQTWIICNGNFAQISQTLQVSSTKR